MERMSKEKESGTLLGVGTAYLPVKEIKGEFYVKVSDFTRCMDSMRNELEEENKKLKSDLEECECSMHFENDEVGYRKRECKKLKEELKYYKEKTEFLNKVIVKYQEELSAYDREYYDEDKKANKIYKKQYEHSMGEDDELIYEEGLYD